MAGRNYCLLAIALIIFLQACAPAAPAPAPVAPVDINAIVAQTANAAASMTAVFYSPVPTATFTSIPTELPTLLPVITSTPFVFSLPQTPALGSSDAEFACGIVSQQPMNNATFAPDIFFETRWKVQNIGKLSWDSGNMDYRYSSGASLHVQDIYDLPVTVAPGTQVDIVVAMKSPASSGSYTTTWVLRKGRKEFCPLSLTIIVN